MPCETRQILDALARRHDQPRNGHVRAWVYAEEVRVRNRLVQVVYDPQPDTQRS